MLKLFEETPAVGLTFDQDAVRRFAA